MAKTAPEEITADISGLLHLMRALRDKDHGCPWDLEQDFKSVAPYTLEEAYEVIAAIESGDLQGLKGELGDLLFQVVFHAQMASEKGLFDFDAVVDGIVTKMIRRHPHVFADARVADVEEQSREWDKAKQAERVKDRSESCDPFHGITHALPALVEAAKVQRRVARHGFDWNYTLEVIDKVREELDELEHSFAVEGEDRVAEELGDLLFSCVNLSRHLNVDAEQILRGATQRFMLRYRKMDRMAAEKGNKLEEMSIEQQEILWQRVKKIAN